MKNTVAYSKSHVQYIRKIIKNSIMGADNSDLYKRIRDRHVMLSMNEHKYVTGQGAIDAYPAGYPIK